MADPLIAAPITAKLIKFKVPAEQVVANARAEAEAIVATAHRTAIEIVPAANARATDMIAESERRALQTAERRASELLFQVNARVNADMADLRASLAQILRNGLEKIIGEQCGTHVLARVVDRALQAIDRSSSIEIQVNPIDAPTITGHSAWLQRSDAATNVRILLDPQVDAGSAMIIAGSVRTRVGLADQLELFEQLLRGQTSD